jgi:hypothetical protein
VTGLRLSAVGEGISVRVTTVIDGANDPVLVLEALQNIFPEIETQLPEKPEFPSEKSTKIDFEGISLATYLEKLHQQRILDTICLDAYSTIVLPLILAGKRLWSARCHSQYPVKFR